MRRHVAALALRRPWPRGVALGCKGGGDGFCVSDATAIAIAIFLIVAVVVADVVVQVKRRPKQPERRSHTTHHTSVRAAAAPVPECQRKGDNQHTHARRIAVAVHTLVGKAQPKAAEHQPRK